MCSVNEIYELLSIAPQEANSKAISLLESAKSQEDKDSINWARAYALVELNEFVEAMEIWQGIYDRTKSHKALHQVGFVHRSAGNVSIALDVFNQELALISNDDTQSIAVNLYEQSYCNLLLGYTSKAHEFFNRYECLPLKEIDLIERGCFFRLKGDLYKSKDRATAKIAFEESLKFFIEAKDEISSLEIKERLSAL